MANIFNHEVEIETKYDGLTDRMQVRDTYGEFIPFPMAMWRKCVDIPFAKYFRQKRTPYQKVIEIFIGEYKHRYIGKN